jgi:hypothetical protein
MVIEFERTKREFCGRSILITSWYDDEHQNWCGAAPSYSHLKALSTADGRKTCPTRKAAIDQIMSLLTSHFAESTPVHSERLIFI